MVLRKTSVEPQDTEIYDGNSTVRITLKGFSHWDFAPEDKESQRPGHWAQLMRVVAAEGGERKNQAS